MSNWFESLTGITPESPAAVRASLRVEDGRLTSIANGGSWGCGRLETPSLAELRSARHVNAQVVERAPSPAAPTRPTLVELVADAIQLHADTRNAGALFQVASQFNLLEMSSPGVTPEQGVGRYGDDKTQGPACAISAGAGTIYRNYFAPTNGRVGQSHDNQIDCLADLGRMLGNHGDRLWRMSNGYALPTREGLREIKDHISSAGPARRDALRAAVRVGLHRDVEVTLAEAGHSVSQVFCSALPIGYAAHDLCLWEPFARLVLEATYEATLLAALACDTRRVYLTLVGGGVFRNPLVWILDALERAVELANGTNLEISLVSHRASNPQVQAAIQRIVRSR